MRGQGHMAELSTLRQQRDALDDQIDRLQWDLRFGDLSADGERDAVRAFLDAISNLQVRMRLHASGSTRVPVFADFPAAGIPAGMPTAQTLDHKSDGGIGSRLRQHRLWFCGRGAGPA